MRVESASSCSRRPRRRSASVTVTVGYTAGTSVVADVVDAVAYGTPSTTYAAARAGQGQLRLVTAEGGSTTYTTSVPISYTAGDSYTLTLEVVDQVATAYWQGQPLAAVGPTGLDCSDSVGLGFEALFGAARFSDPQYRRHYPVRRLLPNTQRRVRMSSRYPHDYDEG